MPRKRKPPPDLRDTPWYDFCLLWRRIGWIELNIADGTITR